MREQMRRRMQGWGFILSLFLAGFSLLLSYLFKAGMLYSIGKAVIIFLIMYFMCRIFILIWYKANGKSDFDSIKTTMNSLDDLEEKGIKITYNPLPEAEDSDYRSGEAVPGQINMDNMSQHNEK